VKSFISLVSNPPPSHDANVIERVCVYNVRVCVCVCVRVCVCDTYNAQK